MWKRLSIVPLVLLLSFPSLSLALTLDELRAQMDALIAQIQNLQKQAAAQAGGAVPLTSAGVSCPSLSRNLSRGMQGEDVRSLQVFLKARNHLTAEPTGFYGALTEGAVQAFQSKENLVTSGSAQTSGWGFIGPKTRARIAQLCAVAEVPAPVTCPQTPVVAAQESCLGVWEKINDSRSCHIGWRCRLADVGQFGNKPPVIARIDGPLELLVNQSGSWAISAQDPESGSLEYSVIWGDEGTSDILSLLAGVSAMRFGTSPRFTHAYTAIGNYTPEITVRDGAGNSSTATLPITVGAKNASSTEVAPLPDAPVFGSCDYQGTNHAEGTIAEGHSINDLCLATVNTCQNRGVYVAKFVCDTGAWRLKLENPFPTLPNYGNTVGTPCSQNGARKDAVVAPNTQICRGLLCASAQNYAKISLMCSYTNWVDWGIFTAGATTTTICSNPTPCEYGFGSGGRACASKVNGSCQGAPMQDWPI